MSIFKSKFFLGVMIVAVMLVGFGMVTTHQAAAATVTITHTLKAGSTYTAEVKVLQAALGLTADGKFGPKTTAAVKAWQATKGLVADGVFGAKSRAAFNGGEEAEGGCPVGQFNPLTGAPCTGTPTGPVCPVGQFDPATGHPCAGTTGTTPVVSMNGTDGSITGSTSSYVSSGIQLKKGDTKDIVAERLQAVNGPVQVTRVTVDMSVRPWLFFSQLTLHDSNGHVIATKAMTDATSATEVTVGSDYQVIFDAVNYVVTPGTNVDLVVGATVLTGTDKIPSGGQSVDVAFTNIRTTNGVGYLDTVSNVGTLNGTVTLGANLVTLTATGSVADMFTRISPSSPLTGQQVVSTTQTTSNATLGIFSVKSANNSSTLNTLSVGVVYTPGSSAPALAAAFSNYRLYVNGLNVAGGVLNATGYPTNSITFSNLTVPLTQDTWTDLTVEADINATTATTNSTVQLTLTPVATATTNNPVNPVVTDANYNTANIELGVATSNLLTLTANSVSVTNATATLGSAIVQSNSTVGYNATYAFTLTNNSNNNLYVSTTAATFLGMTGTGGALTSITASPSTVNGDDTYNYAIPAGSARTFTFSATIRGTSGNSYTYKAQQVNYGITPGTTSSTPTGQLVNSNLSALTLTAAF